MNPQSGRGRTATTDMKARIAALIAQGNSIDNIIEILWERNHRAEVGGEGFTYEYSAIEVRPSRQRGQ